MFQKETTFQIQHQIRKGITTFIVVGLCLSGFSLHGRSDFKSEAFLESVSIDDLISAKTVVSDGEDSADTASENTIVADNPKGISPPAVKAEVVPEVEFLLEEKTVLEEIRHQLASHFELSDGFKVYFEKPWVPIKLDSVDWELEMTSFPSNGLRSRFYTSFELWVNGERQSTWQPGLRCELWINAYVAQQQINRDSVVRESFFAVKPIDSLTLYRGPVEIGTPLTDYMTVNSIRAGEPLFWKHLKERPLIERNSIIDVVAEDGLLKVTLKAKALEDGIKGQVIRIRNLQSYNDIQAEVIGVNQAKVYF